MVRLTKVEREVLMLEYKELLDEILHRRRNTWLIHSILLASTFIISFGIDTPELLPYPYIVSLILVVFSWLFQRTARHVNNSCWTRRQDIEDMLGMKGPKERYKKLKKTKWYRIRRRLWPTLWFSLGITYFLLLVPYLLHIFTISIDC